MKSVYNLTSSDFERKLNSETGMLCFEKGTCFIEKKDSRKCRYSFSNTQFTDNQHAAYIIKNRKDIVIDGNDSLMVFRGHMTPFIIDSSENVTIKNLTVDFDPPLVAEGTILSRTDEYIDVFVDNEKFPHFCRDNWLFFDIGDEEPSPLTTFSQIRFGRDLTVAHSSADDFTVDRAEDIDLNTVRFFPADKESIKAAEPGELFVIRHNSRLHPGFFIENCKNVILENITVHSCGGLGVLAQFSEDITCRNVCFLPNRDKGRRISCGRDDGMHITSCRGKVLIEGCSFLGLMDDPINIHGCSLRIDDVLNDGKTVRAHYMHEDAKNFSYYSRPGDTIRIIDARHMNEVENATAQSWEKESEDTILLHFTEAISIRKGDYAIENISSTCEFVCRKNRFGSCRARGLLVSTPKKVVIEGNLFESSGSGILIPGDANYWYESGECHDVTIENNVFTNHCMTSMYQYTHGMISICPIVPEPVEQMPFHKNITVKNNTFDTSDTPVLYAFSTENLTFEGNTVFANCAAENVCDRTALISLCYCNNVKIENNTLTGKYSNTYIECEHCNNVAKQIFPT